VSRPSECFEDLTFVEECVIARRHPTGRILKLRPGNRRSPSNHYALRGHMIVLPQDPGPLLHLLPSPQLKFQDLTQTQPALLHGDSDVELLLFPHLYPHGYGHFIQGERTENNRSSYTRHMDVKRKLASINRDDWYWPSWSYQEIETMRIFQNTQRLISNKTRTAIDNRLPQHEILQQSNYGAQNIINETLSHTIPASIRTGESYFQSKERLVNSVISSRDLSYFRNLFLKLRILS
jgi:hypothetical protein